MDTALWTVQVLWGVFCSLNGFSKICFYDLAPWVIFIVRVIKGFAVHGALLLVN